MAKSEVKRVRRQRRRAPAQQSSRSSGGSGAPLAAGPDALLPPIAIGRGTAADPLEDFDDLDRQIVTTLQFDGRRSYASIARKLGISEGTVRARVNQLAREKFLRFIAVIDPIQFGKMSWGMLGINVTAGTSPHDLARYFAALREVTYVMVVAARFDLLVEVQFQNIGELNSFLERHCYGSGKVSTVETMMGLKLHKWLSPIPGDSQGD